MVDINAAGSDVDVTFWWLVSPVTVAEQDPGGPIGVAMIGIAWFVCGSIRARTP